MAFAIKSLLLTIVLIQAAHAGKLNLEKLADSRWSLAESEHFIVLTDVKPKQAEIYARELENFKRFVNFYLQSPSESQMSKATFILVKKDSTFLNFGFDNIFSGVFLNHPSGPVALAKAGGFHKGKVKPSEDSQVPRHELVHFIVANSKSSFTPSLWYSEGIAEYLSTYSRNDKVVNVGSLLDMKNRLSAIANPGGHGFELYSVEQLFKATESHQSTNQKKWAYEKAEFYARSFAVVHYLMSSQERLQELGAYLQLTNRGASVDEAFAAAFKRSFTSLDKEVHKYINGRYVSGFSVSVSTVGQYDGAIDTKGLDRSEAESMLRHLMLDKFGLEAAQ